MKKRALLLAVATAATACQNDSSSDTDSLDNLGRGEAQLSLNECGDGSAPELAEQLDPSVLARAEEAVVVPVEHRQALLKALSVIPRNLKDTFFAVGYRIHVGDGIAAKCNLSGDGAESARACLQEEILGTGQDEYRLTVHVANDSAAIAHGLVRGFFLAVGPSLSSLDVAKGQVVIGQDEDVDFKALKARLVAAVNSDFTALGKTAGVSGTPEEIADAIFAESADSFFCSATTRKTMETYPQAYSLFANEVVGYLSALESPVELDSDTGQGLSLRRSFFGNRVRQTGYVFPRLHGFRRNGWGRGPGGRWRRSWN